MIETEEIIIEKKKFENKNEHLMLFFIISPNLYNLGYLELLSFFLFRYCCSR